jgi:hypothetical protein
MDEVCLSGCGWVERMEITWKRWRWKNGKAPGVQIEFDL